LLRVLSHALRESRAAAKHDGNGRDNCKSFGSHAL
jgi:hypothetical protein